MGLAWQQGPLSRATVGHFISPAPLPERLLLSEPLRRRMRVQLGGRWLADSDRVILLHEPGHYPVALFPLQHVELQHLVAEGRRTTHKDLGPVEWYTVTVGDTVTPRAAWRYAEVPQYAAELADHVAFAWRAMDAFYEEDERIVGHAADPYHRTDIRRTTRHLVVTDGERVIADTKRPFVLYESGFAPRWYVPRDDVDESALSTNVTQTFCPYKGLASYYDIGPHQGAAWYYPDAWPEAARVGDMISFEPDQVVVFLDGEQLHLEPGQTVIAHGLDRGLDPDEILQRTRPE